MQDLIKELAQSPITYDQWFNLATEHDIDQLWNYVWDRAAQTHTGNSFVEGVYDFYQRTGHLSHSQFHYLCKAVFPGSVKAQGLRERLNAHE